MPFNIEGGLLVDGKNVITEDAVSKNFEEITWADLKALRDAGQLVSGKQYRITDYVTTTVQANTQSANHPFDLIVTALTNNILDHEAKACLHTGDTYFANNDLTAWKVWYCLDNDTNRFAWADSTNGKGVIYRLIDEFENDCPYDFKNIIMTDPASHIDTVYTNDTTYDPSGAYKKWGTRTSGDNTYYSWYPLGCEMLYGGAYPSILRYTYSENPKMGDKIYDMQFDSQKGDTATDLGVEVSSNEAHWTGMGPIPFFTFNYKENDEVKDASIIGAVSVCSQNKIGKYINSTTGKQELNIIYFISNSSTLDCEKIIIKENCHTFYLQQKTYNVTINENCKELKFKDQSPELGYFIDFEIKRNTVGSISNDRKDISNTNKAKGAIKVTVAQLRSLASSGDLIPGETYRITDYQLKLNYGGIVLAPYSLFKGADGKQMFASAITKSYFDILVTATSESTLSQDAGACRSEWVGTKYSVTFNDDITVSDLYIFEGIKGYYVIAKELGIFAGKNSEMIVRKTDVTINGNTATVSSRASTSFDLKDPSDTYPYNSVRFSEWQIKYDLLTSNAGSDSFGWSSHEKGTIYWLKDEHDNECPYDFKNLTYSLRKRTGLIKMQSMYSSYIEEYTLYRAYEGDEKVDNKIYYCFALPYVPTPSGSPIPNISCIYCSDENPSASSTFYKKEGASFSAVSFSEYIAYTAEDITDDLIKTDLYPFFTFSLNGYDYSVGNADHRIGVRQNKIKTYRDSDGKRSLNWIFMAADYGVSQYRDQTGPTIQNSYEDRDNLSYFINSEFEENCNAIGILSSGNVIVNNVKFGKGSENILFAYLYNEKFTNNNYNYFFGKLTLRNVEFGYLCNRVYHIYKTTNNQANKAPLWHNVKIGNYFVNNNFIHYRGNCVSNLTIGDNATKNTFTCAANVYGTAEDSLNYKNSDVTHSTVDFHTNIGDDFANSEIYLGVTKIKIGNKVSEIRAACALESDYIEIGDRCKQIYLGTALTETFVDGTDYTNAFQYSSFKCGSNCNLIRCIGQYSHFVFEDNCKNISIGTEDSDRVNYMDSSCIVERNCAYLYITCDDKTASSSNKIKNFTIRKGTEGDSDANRLTVNIPSRNTVYLTELYRDIDGKYIMKWPSTLLTYAGKYKTTVTDESWTAIS